MGLSVAGGRGELPGRFRFDRLSTGADKPEVFESPQANIMEKRHPILPPFYVFGGLAIMLVVHFFAPGIRIIPMPWGLAGAVLMVAGLALTIISAQTFHRADTPVRPFEESTELVTYGPFRFSRNPMYLGMVVALVGTAILLGTLTPWLVPPVFAAVIHQFFIVPEEKLMERTFGDKYRSYQTRVRRWF